MPRAELLVPVPWNAGPGWISVKSTSKKTARVRVTTAPRSSSRRACPERVGGSSRRACDSDRRALRIEHLGRRGAHVVQRHRRGEGRQPAIVVEAEPELLRGLQERRDALVGFEHARDRSDQVLARLLQLALGRAVASERAHFGIDRRERALDVRRIDAGADDQRPLADARVERAERVVRHPLALADVVRQPPAEAELPEDVVHHPVGVVARIEAAMVVKPYAMSVCDLPGMSIVALPIAPVRHGGGGTGTSRRAAAVPALELGAARSSACAGADVADDRRA